MKKTLLIILGIIAILLVLGVWGYLMLYGVPQSRGDVFADLGFTVGNTPEEFASEPSGPIINTDLPEVVPEALKQLSIRPVAGATLVHEGEDVFVRYVERGTGYVFEINLKNGSEGRISATTFSRITDAMFSPDGSRVALITEGSNVREVFVGTILFDTSGEEKLEGVDLPRNVDNVIFSEDSSLVRFTTSDNDGTRGYQQNLATNERAQLFDIPLMSISMIWDKDGEIFVYSRPTSALEGFVYKIQNGVLTRTVRGGFGLMVEISDDYIVRSKLDAGEFTIDAISRTDGNIRILPIPIIPEKCDFNPNDGTTLWCAFPFDTPDAEYPDDWYKGVLTLQDSLWKIDIDNQEASLYTNFLSTSGRAIDATKLSTDGVRVLFINKLDGMLWLFDSSL